MSNKQESFYKLGVSYYDPKSGELRRFRDYRQLGYTIEPLAIVNFDSYEECHEKEVVLKRLIKNNLYTPYR